MAAKTITLPLGSALFIDISSTNTPDWKALTEHNRQPIQLSIERIEQSKRMANGSLRKFYVADKTSIGVSWNMVPSFSNLTVDGKYGAVDIKNFYESSQGQKTFKVKLVYGKNQTAPFADRIEGGTFMEMSFASCSFDVVRRNVKDKASDPAQEFWNVSLSLVEV